MSTAGEGDALRHKKRKMHKEQVQVQVAVLPNAPETPEPKPLPPVPLERTPVQSAASETPILEDEATAAVWRRKKREEGKPLMSLAFSPAAAVQTPVLDEEEKRRPFISMMKKKKRKGMEDGDEQMLSSSSLPTAARIALCEQADERRMKRRRNKEKQEQAKGRAVGRAPAPPPLKHEREKPDDPKGKGVKLSDSKKQRVLSTLEIIKMRMELRKQQQLPEGFVTAMAMCSIPNSNCSCVEQNRNHSSPFGAFFDQFCYKPFRQVHSRALPRTPECLAEPPRLCRTSSELSQLTASETSRAVKRNISRTSKTHILKRKQPSSISGSQEKALVKEKEKPENKSMTKKLRKPPPLLTHAEKCSDKYRRLPLDQLVPPPRSPHKLLQEKYASDPWKVIVICMLLNLTQGKQVRRKVKGFFRRYPDAQTAFNADHEKMANYLAPLGLQHVKANRIQKFSKAYVEEEWTYITELCGVGKYAADAYAIFCAGRATEVVPKDHKLVDYWKYVCFELPRIQGMQNVQEDAVTELKNVVPKVQQLALCC